MEQNSWRKLAIMSAISFVAMYALMYSTVDKLEDATLSQSRAYMAGAMTTAMIAIELVVMSAMYKNAAVRNILIAATIVLTVVLVVMTRYQTLIYDKQFLRAMIPHHSGAILMCENPKLDDPEIKQLCSSIIESQQREINEMNAIMQRK